MRTVAVAGALLVVIASTAACESRGDRDPATPSPSTSPTAIADTYEHESGPQSPIAYGLQVPEGATQLGPLARYRSAALIAAYQPALDAALAARKAAEDQRKAEAEAEGTVLPSASPTPATRPSDDTFKPMGDPPRPDTTLSVMRIDESPTTVVRRLIAQIDAVLPEAGVVTDDLAKYCAEVERRIVSCRLDVTGTTKNERDLHVVLTVDPGDLASRTSRLASDTQPVMTLLVEYVGDPRDGQENRDEDDDVDVPSEPVGEEKSDLIWPAMDLDSPADAPLFTDWTTPSGTAVLLSGGAPQFVALVTERGRRADDVAAEFVSRYGTPTKDVAEDLNEISTTYRATAKNGTQATAIYVLSARGNYALLLLTPKTK